MRIERAPRWPAVPAWAALIVLSYLAAVSLALWVGQVYAHGPPSLCVFRNVSGYPCAGCGSTRMVLSLLDGDLVQAARFNPAMFALAVGGTLALMLRLMTRRRIVWITSPLSRMLVSAVIVAVFLLNWSYVLRTDPGRTSTYPHGVTTAQANLSTLAQSP